MGVDSNMLCLLKENQGTANVVVAIEQAVHNLIALGKRLDPSKESTLKSIERREPGDMLHGMTNFIFIFMGEGRSIAVHENCHNDGVEEVGEGPRVICSIGMWGSFETIINHLAFVCVDFGKTYIKMNDSSDTYSLFSKELYNKLSLKNKMTDLFPPQSSELVNISIKLNQD